MSIRLAAFLLSICAGSGALAQGYPAKPISIIVPYAAGGTNDLLAREVSAKLSVSMGVPVVVENRSGAGGNIGARHVARAAPDGYTLGAVPVGVLSINQWIYADAGFDPAKDLAPITMAGSVPNVLTVNPSLPVHNVEELIQYARAHPGKLSFASMGVGTTGHLCGEMLKMLTKVDITHVPYKGAAPALSDLLAGHVQMMCDNLTNAMPHIKAGKLRALAVTSLKRAPMLPDTPTLSEAGVEGFEATAWFGFVAPAATPRPIIDKLNAELVKALRDPEVGQRLANLGLMTVADTPEEFARFISSETKKWKEVVQRSGAKAN